LALFQFSIAKYRSDEATAGQPTIGLDLKQGLVDKPRAGAY